MSRREGVKLALLVVLAACQSKTEPTPTAAGSGSAATAVQLTACAVADPRPSKMRFGFPAVTDGAVPVPTGDVGSKGVRTRGARFAPSPQASVVLTSIEVTGALDKMVARRYVRRGMGQLGACATPAIPKDATLKMQFVIDKRGVVNTVRATGVEGALPACATQVIEQTKFSAADSGTSQITLVLRFSPPPAVAAPPPPAPPTGWTPYAVVRAPQPADPSTIEAMQTEVRAHLAELDACFGAARGSVRAMISITADGHVQRARVGGLGVQAPEVCLERAIQKLAVTAPAAPVELACDLVRGEPQPWRVTRENYAVFEVDATRMVRPDGIAHAFSDPGDLGLWTGASPGGFLVLATPDAPGSAIERTVVQASGGTLSIIAVTATGGPPVFVGVGPDVETTIDGAGNLGIAVTKGVARVCTDGADPAQIARVVDPPGLDALIADGLAACRTPCTAASVSVVGDYVGKDLVAVTAAARRAKLATIVSGQGCPR